MVKGTNFVDLRDAGDPVELAIRYDSEGADELVFLDITATSDNRGYLLEMITRTANAIHIPFTIGGGIRETANIQDVLYAGADKVSLNSAAVKNPRLVADGSRQFGAQCIVVAIDARRITSHTEKPTTYIDSILSDGFTADLAIDETTAWEMVIHGGRLSTGIDAVKWARWMDQLGAGELLLTSMDQDGTKQGYDLALTSAVCEGVRIPVIASGGAGTASHISDALQVCEAALLASLLHFRELTISEIKAHCDQAGLPMRLTDLGI